MIRLEQYEWCDFWWEEADKNEKDRVLFIGDSITRDYRPIVNELIKEKAYVDMLATSKALDNPSLIHEIDYILGHEDFKYKVIHFNNGLHGWHLSDGEFEKWLDEVVYHIIKNAEDAKIILALATPITKNGNVKEINQELTTRVLKRNEAMEYICRKYNLLINDLYTPMLGKSEYRLEDGYHYNETGKKIQGDIVAKRILDVLAD